VKLVEKWFIVILIGTLILSPAIFISRVESGIYDPFHTKEEKISMWKLLWDAHPNTTYISVGKTYAGNDIWMFMAGNSSGGTILLDGEMHGNEDKGSELLFLMAEWLLESEDPQAKRILEWNYILFIPQLDDQNNRGNANTEISTFGVDLNRNFKTGWWLASPSDDTYGGPYPLSEPETQVLRNVLLTYKPTFYVNMHCGAGPYAAYNRDGNLTLTQEVISRTNALSASMGISPYRNPIFSSQGFSIGDAINLGVKSAWLIETVGSATAWRHLPEHYEELVDTYLPKCLAIFIAMAETCSTAPTSLKVIEITQNPSGSIVYTYGPVTVQATLESVANVRRVVMTYNLGTQATYMVYMTNIGEGKWSGEIPPTIESKTITYTINAEDYLATKTSSESFMYQTSPYVIPEFSSSIILIFLTISSLFILIAKRHLNPRPSI